MFKRSISSLLILIACSAAFAPAAQAEPTPGTGWQAFANSYPTNLPPGGNGEIQIDFFNTGAMPAGCTTALFDSEQTKYEEAIAEGLAHPLPVKCPSDSPPPTNPITVTDVLPPGVTATAVGGVAAGIQSGTEGSRPESPEEEEKEAVAENQKSRERGGARWSCHGTTVVTCTSNPTYMEPVPHGAGQNVRLLERLAIEVKVGTGVSGTFPNRVTVSGGGAAGTAASSDPVTISSSAPGFGFSNWNVWFSNADGTLDTQAGSHPYETTFAVGFNRLANGELAGGEARDLQAELPPGFFGEPGAVPQCTRAQLDGQNCSVQSQLGDLIVFYDSPDKRSGPGPYLVLPVYNMVPPPGVPDELGTELIGFATFLDAAVSSGGGDDIVEHIDNIPQIKLEESVLTLWGVAPEASHNAGRSSFNSSIEASECRDFGCPSAALPKPFLTLPTSCEAPQPFTIHGLSTWTDEHVNPEATVFSHDETGTETGFTGCEALSFAPSLSAVPDTSFADTPAGLSVEVKVPQEDLRVPEGLVASTLKNTTVTLPEGVVINPGQAAGLQACGDAEANVHGEGPQSCPSASKVGTVKIRTPLLEGELESELEGDVYVLQSNPPELKLLLAASGDGIYLKLVGTVHLNEQTGQLTTTFAETPSLPFTDFRLTFSGGAQAALDTPTQCGTYGTSSDFTPWATPFGADVLGSDSFQITSGPGGGACPSTPLPFSPELIAGATTDQAGGFTNFSLLLARGDASSGSKSSSSKPPRV